MRKRRLEDNVDRHLVSPLHRRRLVPTGKSMSLVVMATAARMVMVYGVRVRMICFLVVVVTAAKQPDSRLAFRQV